MRRGTEDISESGIWPSRFDSTKFPHNGTGKANSTRHEEKRPEAGSRQQEETTQQPRQGLDHPVETRFCEWKEWHVGEELKQKKIVRERT